MIKRESIENLKNHVDLYQVVSDYVSLQKSGGAWKGLSPFTQEKTASFFVYPDRGFFYCFSSSQGGDAIKFLQIKENFTFVEAVEALADRFNFKLEYERSDGRPAAVGGSRLKRLRTLHQHALEYYVKAFRAEVPEALAAREYWLEKRGFTIGHAEEHEIGYAPADGSRFFEYLRKRGFSDEEMEASGLFFPKRRSIGLSMARFRGRLMIPIRDLTGNVIAFTGRKLDQTPENDPAFEAKYVNSPGTDLFNKGTMLFGLHLARKAVSEERPFVMVEGQLDAIRAWTMGFEETIATQGTAITEVQLGKLKNYSSRLIMCLDGDAAGAKAALRVLPMALSIGLELRFIRLDKGDDPDTFLLREGAEGFRDLLTRSMSVTDFLLRLYFSGNDREPAAIARSLQQCFEFISKSASEIEKDRLVEEIASRVGLDVQHAKQDFFRFQQKNARRNRSYADPENGRQTQEPSRKLRTAESDLLRLIIRYPEVRERVRQLDFTEIIRTDHLEGRLLARVCAELVENHAWLPESGIDELCEEDEERNLLYRLMADDFEEENPIGLFSVCFRSMQLRYDKERLKTIDRRINNPSTTDENELNMLLREKVEIQKRIANPALN